MLPVVENKQQLQNTLFLLFCKTVKEADTALNGRAARATVSDPIPTVFSQLDVTPGISQSNNFCPYRAFIQSVLSNN